jgi:hypothetical protein
VTCSGAAGMGTAQVTLKASGTHGFPWISPNGVYSFNGNLVNPLFRTSTALGIDFDPNLLTLIPSTTRPGQQMLSVNTANLPSGPVGQSGAQGPPGVSGVNCTSGMCNGIVVVTNPDGTVSPSINSAVTETRSLDVQNVDHWCVDNTGTIAYVCGTGSPAAWGNGGQPGYASGSWVFLVPSMTSLGPASLNVNSQGVASIKLSDGATDPGSLLVQGRWYLLVFNGTVWTMSQGDSHQ